MTDKNIQLPSTEELLNQNKNLGLLLALTCLNTLAIVGVGSFLIMKKQAEVIAPTINSFNESHSEAKNRYKDMDYAVPLDYFLINLADGQGLRQFKVEMEFNVDNADVLEEINKRMPQIRDTNILLLSSLNYQQISTPHGKIRLKEEIRTTVNSYLTKGKINEVLFTNFIYN